MNHCVKATISDRAQLLALRKDVRDALNHRRVPEESREAVLLALTEIGTNLVNHARGGILEVSFPEDHPSVIRVTSVNLHEPDAPDPSSLGLGIGLDSLSRIMDRVSVQTVDGTFRVVTEIDLPSPVRA